MAGRLDGVTALSASSPPADDGQPVLKMHGVRKRFGGVEALKGTDLVIQTPGTVMGLLGENGSGKSTLLGVLSGQVVPDGGSIVIAGRTTRMTSPRVAVDAGIALVSQETAVASQLSVAENVMLGRLPGHRFRISRSDMRARAREVLASLNLDYDPDDLVGTLRPDQRQMVEIARAMSMDAKVVVLDEPTSSLTEQEATSLFDVVRGMSVRGVSTILVSHRLAEMFEIVDELTILRDGMTASSGRIGSYDVERIIVDMTGRPAVPTISAGQVRTDHKRPPILVCTDLVSGAAVRGVDLDVYPGEVVGVAGLVGAGRSELFEALFGMRSIDGGALRLAGVEFQPRSPREAIARGLAFVPPERKTQGAVLSMAVGDNLTMAETAGRQRWRRPPADLARRAFAAAQAEMSLRAASQHVGVGTLSGGNQQKVVLAKWLRTNPQVLLLDEPTRGVDVGAKREIHALLRSVADGGCAVLVSSSENDELLSLCDRILVMVKGRIAQVVRPNAVTEVELTEMTGGPR